MAAKGRRPLESCRLLEKAGENFAWAKPRGRVRRRNSQPNGRECQRGLPRLKKAGENFTNAAPQGLPCPVAALQLLQIDRQPQL